MSKEERRIRKGKSSVLESLKHPAEIIVKHPTGFESDTDVVQEIKSLYPECEGKLNGDKIEIVICKCDTRFAALRGSEEGLGRLLSDPFRTSPGGSQGDPNIKIDIDRDEEDGATECCCSFPPHYDNTFATSCHPRAIKIGFLDTPITRDVILRKASMEGWDTSRIYLNIETCTPGGYAKEDHGNVVVIRFLEKWFAANESGHLCISSYNVANRRKTDSGDVTTISQFDVLCALAKSAKNQDLYVNMSFGFEVELPFVEEQMKKMAENGTKFICSAGNKNLDLFDAHHNFPSGYARDEKLEESVIEVLGNLGPQSPNDRWWDPANPNHPGSNYVYGLASYTPYVASAVIDPNDLKRAGTSFAAPRIMADLITHGSFATEKLSTPEGEIDVFLENVGLPPENIEV